MYTPAGNVFLRGNNSLRRNRACKTLFLLMYSPIKPPPDLFYFFISSEVNYMIHHLNGILIQKNPLEAIINLHGLAFEVMISARTFDHLPELNQPCMLLTHLVWREEHQYLIGFHADDDRAWFRKLIKISGIGPKVALAILSSLSPIQLAQIIQSEDSIRLTKVPGIGKKTAERIILELSDPQTKKWMQRLNGLDEQLSIPSTKSINTAHDDVCEALQSLGYNTHEIEKTLKYLPQEGLLDDLLRQALRYLSGYPS
jgi:holliday junction DNA helicase RuvA